MTRQWRQVPYLEDLFWERWIRKYMSQLHFRTNWLLSHRKVMVGDLVLLLDESAPRCVWPLAMVIETKPDRDAY